MGSDIAETTGSQIIEIFEFFSYLMRLKSQSEDTAQTESPPSLRGAQPDRSTDMFRFIRSAFKMGS